MKKIVSFALSLLCAATLACGQDAPVNLIKNGNFSEWANGEAVSWSIAPGQQVSQAKEGSPGVPTALKVEIVKDFGKNLGEIRQSIAVASGKKFRFTGMFQSSKPGLCLFMVKLRSNKNELKRISSAEVSNSEWTQAVLEFELGDADEIQILCRFKQSAGFVGGTGAFTDLKLTQIE